MEEPIKCEFCNAKTYEDTVKMSLWEGERLVVIEDIPARVCEQCAEQFYDELTLNRMDVLRATKFPPSEAKRLIQVAVFSLPEIKTKPDLEAA